MSAYVVAIKPSARRTNGRVGALVCRAGSRHAFPSRPAAESWARDLSRAGERRVWVRDANPNDGDDVDGYLVGRIPRRRGERGGASGDQAVLGMVRRDDAQARIEREF